MWKKKKTKCFNSVINILFWTVLEIAAVSLPNLTLKFGKTDFNDALVLCCVSGFFHPSGRRKAVSKVCLLFVSFTIPIFCKILRKSNKTERFLQFNRMKLWACSNSNGSSICPEERREKGVFSLLMFLVAACHAFIFCKRQIILL